MFHNRHEINPYETFSDFYFLYNFFIKNASKNIIIEISHLMPANITKKLHELVEESKDFWHYDCNLVSSSFQ
jgi:hypothetical protein